MVLNKRSLDYTDLCIIVFLAALLYSATILLLHSLPIEVLEFVSKCGFILILLPFLKSVGVTSANLKLYGLKEFREHFVKAAKYALIILGGIAALTGIVGVCIALFSSFDKPGALFIDNLVSGRWGGGGSPSVGHIFKSPVLTFMYFSTNCVLAPIGEEIFFRRFLFVSLRKKYPKAFSIFVSGTLFGAVHFGGFFSAAIAGYILAWIYEREGKLQIPIMLHSLKNLAAVITELALYLV